MTVDEPIDDVGRKGKKSRAGVMSVAERLQSNVVNDSLSNENEFIQLDSSSCPPTLKESLIKWNPTRRLLFNSDSTTRRRSGSLLSS